MKPTTLVQKRLNDKAGIPSTIESYKNHLNIKQIHNNLKLLENKEKFCFKMVTTKNIKSLLQKVKTKKPVVIYFIPFKLVKVAAEPPSQTPIEAMKKICAYNKTTFQTMLKLRLSSPWAKKN